MPKYHYLRNIPVRTLYLYGEILFIPVFIFCFFLSLVPISYDIQTDTHTRDTIAFIYRIYVEKVRMCGGYNRASTVILRTILVHRRSISTMELKPSSTSGVHSICQYVENICTVPYGTYRTGKCIKIFFQDIPT